MLIEELILKADEVSKLLKILANTHRLMILCLLINDEELSVTELNKKIPLNASPLSQHLKVMRDEGLLITRKESQVVYYRIADGRIKQLIGHIKEIYCNEES